MPDRNPDPDFAAAASAIRALFPDVAAVDRQLAEGLTRARGAGVPGAALAVALLEVVGVAHEWNLQSDYAQTITCREAADAIMNAIQRGLADPAVPH
jgi:hypothetical protein